MGDGGRQGKILELQKRRAAFPDGHANTAGSVERFLKALNLEFASSGTLYNVDPDKLTQIRDPLQLVDICDLYWIDWEYNKSLKLIQAKPYALRVRKSLLNLRAVVGDGEAFANDALETLSPDIGLRTVQRLDILDLWIEACDLVVSTPSSVGPRRKHQIDGSLKRIVELWRDLTDQKFSKNIDNAPSIHTPYTEDLRPLSDPVEKRNFLSSSPLFAQRMLEAIDPSIDFLTIKNALRKRPAR